MCCKAHGLSLVQGRLWPVFINTELEQVSVFLWFKEQEFGNIHLLVWLPPLSCEISFHHELLVISKTFFLEIVATAVQASYVVQDFEFVAIES